MRSRGGGVLSASVLVALGTSVLLAGLIGLGLSELGDPPRGGATGSAHAETAAVVVPAVTAQRPAPGKEHRRWARTDSSIPVLTPSVGGSAPTAMPVTTHAVAPSTTTRTTTSTTTARATSTPRTTSPTPSPTPTHGQGKGKANGSGNGHKKP